MLLIIYLMFSVSLFVGALKFIYVTSAAKGKGRELTRKDVLYSTFFSFVPLIQLFFAAWVIYELFNGDLFEDFLEGSFYKEKV